MPSDEGFSLIEVLVVLAVLAVLAAIVAPPLWDLPVSQASFVRTAEIEARRSGRPLLLHVDPSARTFVVMDLARGDTLIHGPVDAELASAFGPDTRRWLISPLGFLASEPASTLR